MRTRRQGHVRRRTADEPLVDFAVLRLWIDHALRTASRRWLISIPLILLCVGAAVVSSLMKPVLYFANARILATPEEGAPGTVSATSSAAAGLSTSAVDGLQSNDAFRSLVRELQLLDRWDRSRTPLLQLKDGALEQLLGVNSTQLDREDALVSMLKEWVFVKVNEQTVEIGATFPDKATAKDIVETMRVRLLAARKAAELSSLEATVRAHQGRVEAANKRVQESVAALEAHLGKKRKGSKPATVRGVQQEGGWGALPDARLMELRSQILATRKSIAEVETSRSKRLAELNALLVEQQANLGEQHPSLIETKEKLTSLKTAGPELTSLRDRESRLVSEFVQAGGRDTDLSELPMPMFSPEALAEDSNAQWLRSRIGLEAAQLADAYKEESTAAIALAAGAAQFPERYATLKAPLADKDPISPPFWKFLLFGAVAGFSLSFAVALLLESRDAKVRAGWQLERTLELPVLGTVPLRAVGTRR